jgi:peptide chain release factor subunit 3
MDEPSVKWSEDRFNEIKKNLTPYLKSCGFDNDKDIVYVPISGLTGDNIKDRAT